MLTRDNHGQLRLEDLNNQVKVDVSAAKIDDAFYTDHCMVLADGELVQGTFHVHVLTMPPIEEPSVTLNVFDVRCALCVVWLLTWAAGRAVWRCCGSFAAPRDCCLPKGR